MLRKINQDENFINLKRFSYDIRKFLERYPEGAPDRLIAMALLITEEEVESIYQDIVGRLRTEFK